jgi:hypothetical protein
MTGAYFEDHPTDPDKVILRKPRHEDDDDIQAYVKPWVGLTDEEYQEILVKHNDGGLILFYNLVEAKLKDKNT